MSPNPRRNHRSSAVQDATTATAPRETRAGAASRPREGAPDTVTMDDEKLRAQVMDSSVPSTRGDKARHSKKKHHRHHHHHKSRDAHSLDTDDYDRMKAPKKPPVKSATRRTPHSDSHHRKHKRENLKSYETMVQDDIEMQISETAKTERVQSSSLPTSRNHRRSTVELRETAHSGRHGSHQHHRKKRASGKVARPVPSTTTSKPHPPTRRGGQFQEEGLDSKPPPVPHFLEQDSGDYFHNDVRYHDNDSADDKKFQRGLRMASGTPVYHPRGAAMAHDEHHNLDDIETAMGHIEPPTTTTQAPVCPGAFREGGGPQDDEETLFTAPEQNPVPPSQSSTPDNAIPEAELVEEGESSLVIADIALEKWWTKRRNVCILITAVVLVLLGVLGAVVGTLRGGESGEGDKVGYFCSNAIPLTIPSSVEGSTTNGTVENVGTGTPCEPNERGIWYTVVGTNNNIIASTCNNYTSYATAISVFRGGCSDLQCVAHNDDGPESFCGKSLDRPSRAVWTSIEGETYSLLVHGQREVGNFRLDIDQVKAENDFCEDAIPLSIAASIEGSTMNATLDDVGAGTRCKSLASGIWYTVVGTGSNIIASTCNDETSYETSISVFRGGCDGLQCAAYYKYASESCYYSSSRLKSREVWTSIEGETYSLLVHGWSSESIGDFRLDISQGDPVENDVCENAIPLQIPSSVQGSTISATLDDVAVTTPCDQPEAPGIWYTVVGTGNNIIASTCNEETSYDTAISVFRGGCDGLQCVAYNDYGPRSLCRFSLLEWRSRAVWTSVRGETYSVLVHGRREVGDFRLDISRQVDPVENDVCEDAIPLSIPSSVQGSTTNATIDASLPCGESTPGVWYSIVGTGSNVTASLCNGDTRFDTFLALFRGSCSSLKCVGTNDDSCGIKSRVRWTATSGVTYYILVQGFSGAVGDFRYGSDIGDFRLEVLEQ